MTRQYAPIDHWLGAADLALRTVWAQPRAARPTPRPPMASASAAALAAEPDSSEANSTGSPSDRLSAGLMRVNHVGEVCAQALYSAQALATRDPALRQHFEAAARDETDHLAWTAERLKALNARPSLLNPFWYAGSFAIGYLAGRRGTAASLGFVIETERQVEQHLLGHLDRLPADDRASRAIVDQMAQDEARHADEAGAAGGVRPPPPVRWLMKAAARVMTATAQRI